jgi:hypothetical protein
MARLMVNGVERDVVLEDTAPLLWALRDALGLTGKTKPPKNSSKKPVKTSRSLSEKTPFAMLFS